MGRPFVNLLKEVTVAHGSITSGYVEAIDLGVEIQRTALSIENTLSSDVVLFLDSPEGQDCTITVTEDTDYVYDEFKHEGSLKIKHSGVAPTAGSIIIRSW